MQNVSCYVVLGYLFCIRQSSSSTGERGTIRLRGRRRVGIPKGQRKKEV